MNLLEFQDMSDFFDRSFFDSLSGDFNELDTCNTKNLREKNLNFIDVFLNLNDMCVNEKYIFSRTLGSDSTWEIFSEIDFLLDQYLDIVAYMKAIFRFQLDLVDFKNLKN